MPGEAQWCEGLGLKEHKPIYEDITDDENEEDSESTSSKEESSTDDDMSTKQYEIAKFNSDASTSDVKICEESNSLANESHTECEERKQGNETKDSDKPGQMSEAEISEDTSPNKLSKSNISTVIKKQYEDEQTKMENTCTREIGENQMENRTDEKHINMSQNELGADYHTSMERKLSHTQQCEPEQTSMNIRSGTNDEDALEEPCHERIFENQRKDDVFHQGMNATVSDTSGRHSQHEITNRKRKQNHSAETQNQSPEERNGISNRCAIGEMDRKEGYVKRSKSEVPHTDITEPSDKKKDSVIEEESTEIEALQKGNRQDPHNIEENQTDNTDAFETDGKNTECKGNAIDCKPSTSKEFNSSRKKEWPHSYVTNNNG